MVTKLEEILQMVYDIQKKYALKIGEIGTDNYNEDLDMCICDLLDVLWALKEVVK